MAIGCLVPSPQSISQVWAGPLDDADIPDPTSAAWFRVGGFSAGPRSAWVALAVAHTDGPGAHLPGHDGQWFERVHVVPRTANLGYILNNREVSVEVWNACRRGLSLASAPVTGPDGVSILSEILAPLVFPEHFSPMQSRVYIALVSVVGEDQVDNLVTWNFTSESFPGAYLEIIGWRIMVFAAKPNGDVGESYGYFTEVIQAWDGTEQRIGLRSIPDRTLSYKTTMISQQDVQNLVSRLLVTGRFSVSIPVWPDAIELTAPVSVGDYIVYADTVGRGFQDGGFCMLWKSDGTWESFVISTVEATHLHLSTATTIAFPLTGSLVIPVVRSRSIADFKVQRLSGEVAEANVAFRVEPA
jgi:hypothetical protein